MANDFIVIHKKVLPEYFEKVLDIKELINQGENVSDACKKVGLARSTFYKYKDFVSMPEKNIEKKILLSLKLVDEPGTLLEVLKERKVESVFLVVEEDNNPAINLYKKLGFVKISEKDIDENRIERIKAIILSMTPKERRDPNIINFSRKNRIAKGSGTSVQEINQLLKQFEQTKQMMKRMKGKRGMRFPF